MKQKDWISWSCCLQTNPTSSVWRQSWLPKPARRHSAMLSSSPTQWTSSNQLWFSLIRNTVTIIESTTLCSQSSFCEVQHSANDVRFLDSPWSSHIVPQVPFRYISINATLVMCLHRTILLEVLHATKNWLQLTFKVPWVPTWVSYTT